MVDLGSVESIVQPMTRRTSTWPCAGTGSSERNITHNRGSSPGKSCYRKVAWGMPVWVGHLQQPVNPHSGNLQIKSSRLFKIELTAFAAGIILGVCVRGNSQEIAGKHHRPSSR